MISWMWKNLSIGRSLIIITAVSVTFLLWMSRFSFMPTKTTNTTDAVLKKILPPLTSRGALRPEFSSIVKERLVHLDLKGAPPKLTFLKKLIVDIKTLGATGLLIEYEDMFPFEGNLSALSAGNAYNRSELKDFLQFCGEQNMRVIPLVQTFGHMEYALKLKEFSNLREDPRSPQDLCPNQKEALDFIELLITQIIEFHLQLPIQFTHIHIGCDEVYKMGVCPVCKGSKKSQLFLQHVTNVVNIVKYEWPQLKVIIWDDMIRKISLENLQLAKFGDLVEPMVWMYGPVVSKVPRTVMWRKYEAIFPALWAASAFKGASMPRGIIPPIQRHIDNNRGWLTVIQREQQKGYTDGFQGLVLTGWQRFNHFAVLCELLPASLPSLFVTLYTVSHANSMDSVDDKGLYKVFQCPPDFFFPSLLPFQVSEYHPMFINCEYLGHNTYKLLLEISKYIGSAQKFVRRHEIEDALFTLYHVDHNFSLPLHVNGEIEKCRGYIKTLKKGAHMIHNALSEIYDEFTIGEYIEQQIYSVLKPLQDFLAKAEMFTNHSYWSQRPFEVPQHIKELY